MASFSTFRLKLPAAGLDTGDSFGSSSSSTLTWNPSIPGSSPTSATLCEPSKAYGTFLCDSDSAKYNMSWHSWKDFLSFLAQEQASNSIELRKVSTRSGAARYLERIHYVCARYGTGGTKAYEKKHPEWSRKVPAKGTDCPCSLKVKTYHGTSTVLGKYSPDHNHPTGVDNLRFTRISNATREWIAGLVRMQVKSQHILEMAHNSRHSSPDLSVESERRSEEQKSDPHRNDFIVLADIRRIEKAIEAENIRLDRDDGRSTSQWAERLRNLDSLLGFKSCACAVPAGSNLASDTFVLMIQTPSQRKQFCRYGNDGIVFIDGTHNTTMYKNMTLTTVLVRDHWGHGLPIAWMIASHGTEETISYFLLLLRAANPLTVPYRWMSDRDFAQINAVVSRYPEAPVWLCWWHVLHAWQQHFVISQNEVLWTKLKALVRIEDYSNFVATVSDIQTLAPKDFWDYFVTNWLAEKYVVMWSAMYRQGRKLHLLSDTNMLLEAWHHVLKGKFLEGRRNRRVDHLVFVLHALVLPYYELKERRRELGFEGENLENQKRSQIATSALAISIEDIQQRSLDDSSTHVLYLVKSASRSEHWYEVDVLAYTCTCPDYPVISFCKHLCAVQKHFPLSDVASSDELDGGTLKDNSVQLAFGLGIAVDNLPVDSVPNVPRPDVIQSVAEKLEHFAACFRTQGSLEQALRIDAWLNEELSKSSQPGRLLPVRQKLSPRLNSWPETQAVMMPAKKTRSKRAGDEAYGAGETSGKKAKKSGTPLSVSQPTAEQSSRSAPVIQAIGPVTTQTTQPPQSQPSQASQTYYRPKTYLY